MTTWELEWGTDILKYKQGSTRKKHIKVEKYFQNKYKIVDGHEGCEDRRKSSWRSDMSQHYTLMVHGYGCLLQPEF